ncbi:hypothetical protein CGRA01v4_13426 [Colletotrichum graminicola]|nr:hypothetical protein CGRA01v4_13426 [Colletotrichum graminicola]
MEVTSLANTALKLSATSGGYQLSATSTVANKASRIVPRGMRVMDKRYGPSPLGYPGCAVVCTGRYGDYRFVIDNSLQPAVQDDITRKSGFWDRNRVFAPAAEGEPMGGLPRRLDGKVYGKGPALAGIRDSASFVKLGEFPRGISQGEPLQSQTP